MESKTRGAIFEQRIIEARWLNHFAAEKQWNTFSECVSVALVIQKAMRMRPIISSSAASCLYHIFSHCHKLTDLKKKVIEHRIHFFIFSTTFIWNISHSKKNLTRYYLNLQRSSCQILVKSDFFRQIFEKELVYQVLWVIQLGNESFHANRQTDGRTDRQIWRANSGF